MSFDEHLLYAVCFGILAIVSLLVFIINMKKKADNALTHRIKLLLIISSFTYCIFEIFRYFK